MTTATLDSPANAATPAALNRKDLDAYRAMLARIVAGETVDDTERRVMQFAAGRSAEQLEGDKRTMANRRDANAYLRGAAEVDAELAALSQRCADEQAEIDRLNREHAARMAPLVDQHAASCNQFQADKLRHRHQAHDARQTLSATMSGESRAEVERLSDRACRATARAKALREKLHNFAEREQKANAAVAESQSVVDRWKSEPLSHFTDDGRAKAAHALKAAIEHRDGLLRMAGELVDLEAEAGEAVAVFDARSVELSRDWRAMRLD
jgi:hypothetical protein